MAEKDTQRSMVHGTKDDRDVIRQKLDDAGIATEEGKINLSDIVQLIGDSEKDASEARETAQHALNPDDVIMQTFLAAGIDPALLDLWRQTSAEQGMNFTAFVMGHLLKNQTAGTLNAPEKTATWAKAPEGTGVGLVQQMEFTCQNPECDFTGQGRLGQLYCTNACAARHKKLKKLEERREALRQRQSRMQRLLSRIMSGSEANESELDEMDALLAGEQGNQGNLPPEVVRAAAELDAVGVAVATDDVELQSAPQQGRTPLQTGALT